MNQLHERLQDKNIEFAGYEIAGYEIAPDAMHMCQERIKPRLHFYKEDLTKKDAHFDLLLMMDVFEHVEDYMGFIRRSSEKSSYSIFHIPLDISIIDLLRNMPIRDRASMGHTPSSLDAGTPSFKAKMLNVLRRFLFSFNQDLTVKLLSGYSLLVLTKQQRAYSSECL